MGGGSYSSDYYAERARIRAETNAPVFKHDHDIRTGTATAGVHEMLDPKNFRNGVREARDSAEHPNSVPIIFGLDVTGSMRRVPGIVHSNLPKLMTTILTGGFLADPQVCFAAIGDSHTDGGPLQVGQFESGNIMEDDLGRFWLEGGGGGTYEEGYEMCLYFAVRHTATDAWEKRKRKGYIFMAGDEKAYSVADPHTIHKIFGGEEPAEGVSLTQLVKEAQERYHVFFIIPAGTNHAHDPALFDYWANLLGSDHVLRLEDVNQICDIVALTIGITEGTANAAALEKLTPAVKEAIDPILAATKATVEKVKKSGRKTARL